MAVKDDCIFCQVIAGDVPGYFVHQDDKCVAFLPPKPINPGHVLVASRQHYDSYIDMPDDIAAHINQTAREIGRRIYSAFKPLRIGFSIVGFEVAHVHIHVIPLYKKYEITSSTYAHVKDGGLVWSDENMHACTEEEQNKILSRIKSG